MESGLKKEKMIVCVLLFFFSCCCVECEAGTGGERVVMLSIFLGTITGSACALLSACLLSFLFRYIRRPPILNGPVVFSPHISPKSLHSAILANETQILLLDGLTVAAIKKLHLTLGLASRRRIQRELHSLAALRHTHLMSLMAYLGEPDRFYLVYEYLPTGSLEDAMRRSRSLQHHIGWDARLRIAIGVIKALHYLHFTCCTLHYDLKPSNVLLDAHFEPRLADCGLANTFDGVRSSQPPYYYAPECFPNFSIYTEKSDIFSFGVILGMLLTGRDPSDPLFGEVTRGGGMGMWFRQVVEAGDGREALDKSLLGEEMEEDEMLMAVRIAAVCLSDMPVDRPSSDELVPMLTQLHSF